MDPDYNCRLCGTTEKRNANHLPYEKSKYARDIKLSLNIDIQNDPSDFPKFICISCQSKLYLWRKKINKSKKANINIQIADFSHLCHQIRTWEDTEKVASTLGWISSNGIENRIFMKIQDDYSHISISFSENNIILKVSGRVVRNDIFQEYTNKYDPETVEMLIRKLEIMKICPGNTDFNDVCRHRHPERLAQFENVDDKVMATEESFGDGSTVRTTNCAIFCNADTERCSQCQLFRSNLHMKRSRMKKMPTETKATHRLDYMTTIQLKERIVNSKHERRTLKRKMDGFTEQIEKLTSTSGVILDAGVSKSFIEIMKNNNQTALSQFKENSPQHILWKQQFEAATKPNLKQMRWHPTLLRWCIALHAKSPAAYRMIKNSNVLLLPHENTLRDYTHFTSAGAGWNPDVILRAMQDYSIIDDPLKTNISILFDEVKVKSGLVYCSETGRLIGFCDLGSINNAIYNFCISETSEPDIATHILAIMIRGIFSRLECVVAHYPCKGFNSHQLYWLIWEGIGILELSGFKVRALVCDGATPNRKFYRIHSLNHDACHWTRNVFALDDRGIYFICDTPHLMKTTRNNFENSGWNNKTRNLMFNGKPIKWSQIVSIVEQDVHGMGLRLLPKITYEHLHLTPTLRMRVKLAVQILSSRVANALQIKGNPDTESTQTFLIMFDKFFDCLNVSNLTKGTYQRKPACLPYVDVNDWRFKWLEEDFLNFLDRWEQEGRDQPNLTAKERKQLCLSRETLEGIRITVKSFVNLAKELLRLPNVRFLLSERFNQDPLEEYFSKQRGMGGRCDNPTVRQFQHNALKLQVAGAPAVMASTRGNCQVRRNEPAIATPLQRRKHRSM